jgi:flavin reductase (DIM6/NTAB) family NADH-FMN oxidoreductase RutF
MFVCQQAAIVAWEVDMMKALPLAKAFMLLEPGPVILVTTADRGKANIMTISWHMVMDFTPRFALVTGPWNYSYRALVKTRECVLALPTVDLAKTVVQIGVCSGADTDKFQKFGLTALKAKSVQAPLIRECVANVECRVAEHIKKHNIFVLDAVRAWVDDRRKERRTIHARGDGTFLVDGRTINYRRLMLSRLPSGI